MPRPTFTQAIMPTSLPRLAAVLLSSWLACSAGVRPARADEAAKTALIEEMFTLTKVDALMQQMMEQVQAMQKKQFQDNKLSAGAQADLDETQAQIMKLISERLGWQKLKPRYSQLYAETFSEDELRAAVEFYRSPAGRAMLEKMPVLMGKSMTLVQEQMGDLTPELERIVKERTEKLRGVQEKNAAQPKTP